MFAFTHSITNCPSMVTAIPIVGFGLWSWRRRTASQSSAQHSWPPMGRSMGWPAIRNCSLATSTPQFATDKNLLPHVIIQVKFTKTIEKPYDGPNHMLGSGFIVDKSGVIVTTTQTVRNYSEVYVRFRGSDRKFAARVSDRFYVQGLALIQLIDQQPPKDNVFGTGDEWPVVHLPQVDARRRQVLSVASVDENDVPDVKDVKTLAAGHVVYAVTNPRFDYHTCVTKGIIAGAPKVGGNGPLCQSAHTYWKHTASVSSGDTGCALVDHVGELLGMNVTQTARNTVYCLPVDYILAYVFSRESKFGSFRVTPKEKSIGALIHLLEESTYNDYNKYAESEQKAIPRQFPGILVWGTDIDFDRTGGADLQRFDVITHVDSKRVVDLHTMYTALDRLDNVNIAWVSASTGQNHQGTLKKKIIGWEMV